MPWGGRTGDTGEVAVWSGFVRLMKQTSLLKRFCAVFNFLLSSFIIQLLYSFRYTVAVITSCRAQKNLSFSDPSLYFKHVSSQTSLFFLVSRLISDFWVSRNNKLQRSKGCITPLTLGSQSYFLIPGVEIQAILIGLRHMATRPRVAVLTYSTVKRLSHFQTSMSRGWTNS